MSEQQAEQQQQPEQQDEGYAEQQPDESGTGTANPNQGTEDEVDKTRSETTDTNAGDDARDGGVAEADTEASTKTDDAG